MPQHVPPRIYRRVPFETAVRLKFDRFHGFVEQYSANLSLGGMFIHSAEPPPLGSEVTVEFHLDDGFELIRGRGRVTWVRQPEESDEAPGFGLRFLELTPGSRELIFRLVERRVREGDRVFDIDDGAPATAAGRLVHDEERALRLEERGAVPPWDRPAPRAGEDTTAVGAAATAAAAGGEIARYGRAAREAAETVQGEAAQAAPARDELAQNGLAQDGWPEEVSARERSAQEGSAQGGLAQNELEQDHLGGDDPTASFAGLVEDDEETTVFGARASGSGDAAGPAAWAAGGGGPTEPHDGAREGVEPGPAAPGAAEWPPRGWSGPESGVAAAAGASPNAPDLPSPAWLRPEAGAGAESYPSPPDQELPPRADRGTEAGAAADGDASPPSHDLPARGGLGPEGDAAAEAGAPPPAQDPRPLPATSGAGSVRPRRGVRLAAAIAAGLAVLALAAFLLFRTWGAGATAAGAVGATRTEPAATAGAEGASRRADGASSGRAPADDGAGSPAAAPAGVGAAPAAPAAPAAGPSAPAAASAAGPRTIERIAWQSRDGGVDFEIAGGGPIAPALVDHFSVAGERPRLVVRIAGVERPYSRGNVAVGGPLVERVRTGFHPAPAGAPGSLHVVFDLAAPGAPAAVDTVDGRVRVRFEER